MSDAVSSILSAYNRSHAIRQHPKQARTRLQGRNLPRQRGRSTVAHSGGILRATAPLSARQYSRHDCLLWIGAAVERWSARTLLPAGARTGPTADALVQRPAVGRSSLRHL